MTTKKKIWSVFEVGAKYEGPLTEVEASSEQRALDTAADHYGVARSKLYALPGALLTGKPPRPRQSHAPRWPRNTQPASRKTTHARKKNVWPSVIGSHDLGTADVRSKDGAYWIVTVPTGYRVDYKPWGPSSEVDLGTFSSRQRARAKITAHARGPRESHATKHDSSGVPDVINLWEGSHSDVPLHSKFWYAVDQGTYHITPVSNPDQPRDVRYDLRFNKKPFGWEKIGPYHKTLVGAVSAAQRHYATLQ